MLQIEGVGNVDGVARLSKHLVQHYRTAWHCNAVAAVHAICREDQCVGMDDCVNMDDKIHAALESGTHCRTQPDFHWRTI